MLRLIRHAAFLLSCSLLAACGSSSPAAPSSTASASATTATTTTTATVTTPAASSSAVSASSPCRITASSSGTPVTAPEGPYYHYAAFGQTSNGLVVTGYTEALYHASVPDGVRMPDGSIGVYYVNGEANGVYLGRLTGSTITPVGPITVDGFVRPNGVVDPDAYVVDGKIRLAYLAGFGTNLTAPRAMCIAESTDGVSFTTLSEAWTLGSGSQSTDPSVIRLRDGSWLMAISDGQSTRIGRSSNGLSFTQFATTSAGGVPELALLDDGRVRLYVCSPPGITAHVSSDGGSTFTQEAVVVPFNALPGRRVICDPSYVPGGGVFIFKAY